MSSVAVTTDRYPQVAPLFHEAGLDPVWLPCIQVEPAEPEVLEEARMLAEGADLLVVSSVRTVDILWPNGPIADVEVAAVGESTAAAAAARGGRVVVTGRAGLRDLVDQLADRLTGAAFPHAAGTNPLTLEMLADAGVHLVEVYRTTPIAPGPTSVDAVVFASPSAVEGWLLTRSLEGLVVGVIGSTTRAALAAPPDVVAARPTYRALAEAMAKHLGVAA